MTANLETKGTICITATFTAEPLADALNYWCQTLALPFEIEFAPYNQVFQQLLDPKSLIAQNRQGFNVILIRFEDWQRDLPAADVVEGFNRSLADLETTLSGFAGRCKTASLIVFCPPSPASQTMAGYAEMYLAAEQRLSTAVAGNTLIYMVSSVELAQTYPVSDTYDAHTDQLGHIPYTPVMYTAIASLIARKITAWRSAPYKVIVLDCDNTLWQGVCAEDGAAGVKISTPYLALQKFMIAQLNAGMLLCLCSKNEEADVWAVFDSHADMQLKREHLVAWRINWQPKSENIQAIAAELNLGLDSLLFIDDNPLECAEVQAHCPAMLTLLLPEPHNIPSFLQHVWAFDKWRLTEEDRQRTNLYQQNTAREHLRTQTLSFHDFLAELELKVEITNMTTAQLARVAQLTERTNQFNFTTRRRSESDLQNLNDKTCLVVQVSDRFGDYGLVGVIIFVQNATALVVDTFLMSCRVLGRGIEQRMLAHLGEIALKKNLEYVEASYIPTAKNRPALTFLQTGAQFSEPSESGVLFKFPAAWAAAATERFNSVETIPQTAEVLSATTPLTGQNRLEAQTILHIARDLSDAEHILQAMLNQPRQARQTALFVPPSTPLEATLAEMWAEVLGLEQVGVDDDFFALGGDSLLVMRLVAKTHRAGLNLTPHDFSCYPTVATLAAHAASAATAPLEQNPPTGLLPLTIAQRWFFSQCFQVPNHWNMAKLFEVPVGSAPQTFEQIVRMLWQHHDALRTHFVQTESGWWQSIALFDETLPIPFSSCDFSALAASEQTDAIERTANETQASLNITEGPLLRVIFFNLGPNKRGRLLIVLHHLIYDGASSIFFDDFETLFQQLSQSQPARLPVKTSPIWQWTERLEAYTRSAGLHDEKDYWLGLPWQEIADLPVDLPENIDKNTWGSAHTIQGRLSPEETEALLREIPRAYNVSVIDVLITALAVTLTGWSNSRWAFFDVVDFARNALPNVADLDLSRTVGWFSMDRHLVLQQEAHDQLADVLKSMQAQLERIPNRGLGYQLLLYGAEDHQLKQLPRAGIALNYDGYQPGDSKQANHLLTGAYEYPGSLWDLRDQRPYLLDCAVQIAEGRLITRWRYSKNLYKQATIKNLAENYIRWLQTLLAEYALEQQGALK